MQYIPFPERDVLQESEAKREKGFNKRKMVSSVECSIAGRRVGLEKKKKPGNLEIGITDPLARTISVEKVCMDVGQRIEE